jgi:opacity protein-like surface antigen
MKKTLILALLCLPLLASELAAQDSEYHPVLSDNFILSVGAFRSDNSFTISAQGNTVDLDGSDIDFGDSVGVDESSTLANVQLRWKFGKGRKWSLWGQYFANDASGQATLEEDVEWQDVVFRQGTFVEGGVEIEILRVFIGRSLFKNEQNDFGIGIGLHNLDLSAYIGGEVILDETASGYERVSASNSQPLPNIGAWYNFSPAKRWALHGRVDWISADIGDYDGTMWNFNAGVNFQAFKHLGLDLSYQYFDIDFNVNKSDWRGGVNMSYSGPVLSATINW